MASSSIKKDAAFNFFVTLALVGTGYYFYRGSRRQEVFDNDFAAARPTKHMVDLRERVDSDKLQRWLHAQETQPSPAPPPGGLPTSARVPPEQRR